MVCSVGSLAWVLDRYPILVKSLKMSYFFSEMWPNNRFSSWPAVAHDFSGQNCTSVEHWNKWWYSCCFGTQKEHWTQNYSGTLYNNYKYQYLGWSWIQYFILFICIILFCGTEAWISARVVYILYSSHIVSFWSSHLSSINSRRVRISVRGYIASHILEHRKNILYLLCMSLLFSD